MVTVLRRLLVFCLLLSLAIPAPQVAAEDTSVDISEIQTDNSEDISPEQTSVPVLGVVPLVTSPIVETVEPIAPVSASTIAIPGPKILQSTTPDLVMTSFAINDGIDFIELYNQSTRPIDMSQVVVSVSDSVSSPQSLRFPSGWLLPKHYSTFAQHPTTIAGSLAFKESSLVLFDVTKITIEYASSLIQSTDVPTGLMWAQHKQRGNVTLKQTGDFLTDFTKKTTAATLFSDPLYIPPADVNGLAIIEVLANARACAPTDLSLDCGDYIKLYNPTDHNIDLAKYRLRIGSKNDTASVTTSFTWHEPTLNPENDELMLESHHNFLLKLRNDGGVLSMTNSGSFVWIEDYYGTKIYQEVAYPDMSSDIRKGVSYAYDELAGAWRYGIPTPGGPNVFLLEEDTLPTVTAMKPCRDDQYRSEETNRCRNIITATSVLMPCKEGQYRSEETNRCRSIATAASILKACSDDQFRNPETGRCKKIASSEELALADCGEGRERNPETNRCRNIKTAGSVPEAVFAVEPIKDTTNAFIGWWALGGVGLLALGYGAWEWHREVLAGLKKIGTFFHSSK